MKKTFLVTVEIPEDPESIATASYLQDVIADFYDSYDDVRYYPTYVRVEEKT